MVSMLQLKKLETELRSLQHLYPGVRLDGVKRLLGLPVIQTDEVFSSWLTRMLLSGKINKKLLLQELGLNRVTHTIDLQPEVLDFNMLVLRFNLVQVQLLESSFIRFGLNERLEDVLCVTADTLKRKPIYRFCPFCLDSNPYIRKQWRYAFSYACIEHRCLLSEKCHKCGHYVAFENLNIPFIKTLEVSNLRHCLKCGADLCKQPAINASEKTIQIVLDEQQRLIDHLSLGRGLREYMAEVRYAEKSDLIFMNIGLSGDLIFKEHADQVRGVFTKAGVFTNTYWQPKGRIYLNSGIGKLKYSKLWVEKQLEKLK